MPEQYPEEGQGRGKDILFDIARKAMSGSVKTMLSTEEGIKAVLAAVVPKEVGQYVGRELTAFRTEFLQALVGEMSRFLARIDPSSEMQKVLAGLTFDIHVQMGISRKEPPAQQAPAPQSAPEPARKPRKARARHGNPLYEHPVTHQYQCQSSNFGPHALVPQIEQSDQKVADGDPLQDSIEAHVSEMKMRKAVDDDPEQEQNAGSLCRVQRQLGARGSPGQPCLIGEDNGSANDKQKGWEHKVGGRQTVPFGVFHLGPCGRASVVVDHDHEDDGDAAQNVERQQAFERRGSGRRVDHEDRTLR